MDHLLGIENLPLNKNLKGKSMSDDKITISMDEVNHATPVPGSTPPPIFTSGYVPPEADQETKPKRTGLFICIGIAAVALLCITVIGVMAVVSPDGKGPNPIGIWQKERTISDCRDEAIQRVNRELSEPDSKIKKWVENTHKTVTVTSTEIVRCDVKTFDGTDNAGKDNSNIDTITMLIRFRWDGIFDKDGYTDLQLVYDVQNKRRESKMVYTTAKIKNDEDWFKLWYSVGYLFGGLFL